MKVAWRICRKRHAASAFSGEGTRRAGGRWNHPGTPVVYTAETASLAIVEMLVHLDPEDTSDDYVLIGAAIPDDLPREALEPASLPDGWMTYPAPDEVREIGERWAKQALTAVLVVPSVVIPRERNYLLNPAHPDMVRITLHPPEPFAFDRRLWSASGTRQ